MLENAQRVRSKIQETLSQMGVDFGPRPSAFCFLLLFPQLLRQLLDEAVPIVGRTETMTAHEQIFRGLQEDQMIGFPPVTATVAPDM